MREIEDGMGCSGYGHLTPDEKAIEQLKAKCKSLRSALAERDKELATSQEKARKLREGLRKLEWSAGPAGGHMICAVCRIQDQYRHGPDCWLSALLEETKP
jgi:hypothetical protein